MSVDLHNVGGQIYKSMFSESPSSAPNRARTRAQQLLIVATLLNGDALR
jgi:hypothetical protein